MSWYTNKSDKFLTGQLKINDMQEIDAILRYAIFLRNIIKKLNKTQYCCTSDVIISSIKIAYALGMDFWKSCINTYTIDIYYYPVNHDSVTINSKN